MLTVAVGLASALVYGSADFLGGLASRRLGAVLASAVSESGGIVVYLVLLLWWPGTLTASAAGWGALAGVFGAAAVGLLYGCLAIGPMSVLSPLAALVSAAVPVAWSMVTGQRLSVLGWVGALVGGGAVVLITMSRHEGAVRATARGLIMAVGAGVMVGAFLIAIDTASPDSGVWPMIAQRTVSGSIMALLAIVLSVYHRSRPPLSTVITTPGRAHARGGAGLAISCGLVDALANAGLLLGLRIGDLAVMAVLTAVYPIGTVILARMTLGERLTPAQIGGLGLAVAAGAFLALA